MPYIDSELRPRFAPGISALQETIQTEGELNYVITRIVLAYLIKKLKYVTLNDVEGTLNHITKEIYRRVAVPYENLAIDRNGDLPEFIQLIEQIDAQTVSFFREKQAKLKAQYIAVNGADGDIGPTRDIKTSKDTKDKNI